jgi:hypothetical protein
LSGSDVRAGSRVEPHVSGEERWTRRGRAPSPGGSKGPPLALLVFVVGAASLGTEIAAARLLAPYFGASTFVWANTIATVLVALSAGYAIAAGWPTAIHICRGSVRSWL